MQTQPRVHANTPTSNRRARLLLTTRIAALACLSLLVTACGDLDETRPPPPPELGVPEARTEVADVDTDRARESLGQSVHAKLDCSDCHKPPPEGAQEGEVGQATCNECHEEAAAAYAETIHARANKKGRNESAARCQDCHGAHDTKAVDDPQSRVHPRRIPLTCGTCHANPELAEKLGIKDPDAAKLYLESIHGRGLVTQGLLVAPSCVSCHGPAHQIFEAENPKSAVHPTNIVDTCGACHHGPRESFLASVHGEALKEGTKIQSGGEEHGAPTCQTCHTAHSIVPAGTTFRLASDRICGDCHEDRLERYLETYHGRAHHLGDESVAACYDCHGKHNILPSKNPLSTLSDENRLQTCQKCHAGAPPNFAGYMAHADHTDKENYPALYWAYVSMTGLLLGTFGFFGVHSMLWLGRTLVVRARDPQGFKKVKKASKPRKGTRLFQRFRPVDRFVHGLVIISFLLLVITGMPIKFHDAPWAQSFLDMMGGPAVAASLHRFGAIITLSYFILHIASMVNLLRKRRAQYRDEHGKMSGKRLLAIMFGPDSPLPRWQDAKDVAAHMKWFFGRGPRPKFDRFTYWEKFDYMAVFWGVTVIGLSGLVLWFPTFFTLILPGWAINIAHIIHSDEALLAAGFIFVFHFFNSHFRPEKFPMDSVMFSGKITEEEMQHERPAQYERLAAEGRLQEEERELGDWPQWQWFVKPFGAAAIILGVLLAVAIFYALLV